MPYLKEARNRSPILRDNSHFTKLDIADATLDLYNIAKIPSPRSPRSMRRAKPRSPRVLLIFDFEWDDAPGILDGIARFARGTWDVQIDSRASAVSDPTWIASSPWDGVITRHISAALVSACANRQIPLVDLNDSPVQKGIPKVRPNNIAVGHMGAEHLLERGFRNFGFCGLTECWSAERRGGFVEALELTGQRCHVLETEYRFTDSTWERDQQIEIGRWLRTLPKPVAVMACNDLRALQVVSACNREGLLVPAEVAVLGANDDHIRCSFGNPPLSSVATDRALAGYRAAEMLDRMMVRKIVVLDEEVLIDPMNVVIRQSTDALAVDDAATAAAINYIKHHACDGISANDVAKHVKLPRHLLERRYRRTVGRSPHVDIRLTQISRAKQLLVESDVPLKLIAQAVGLAHTEYLSVLFRRYTGSPPGKFRRSHQISKAVATPQPTGTYEYAPAN